MEETRRAHEAGEKSPSPLEATPSARVTCLLPLPGACRVAQQQVTDFVLLAWSLVVEMAELLISRSPSVDPKIEKPDEIITTGVLASVQKFLRKCLVAVLSYGPMPKHIAFIMDGNRRYAKFRSIQEGTGHRVGFSALIASLLHCYELGVKYITVYAFSIDNFKRDPSEVQSLMELMEEKINELLENRNVINKINCKINFWGNLDLLCEPVRLAAQKLMASTAGNTGLVFSVCMPYNSTSEIVNAVSEVCAERREMLQEEHAGNCNGHAANNGVHSDISVADLDRHMYSTGCPDPDIVIRTSGETRLSNFLLWQTTFSHLQNPDPLWPEFSLKHLVWAILQYQRVYSYLEENRKLAKKQL
ncbi:dehydrodolichyl diphosphate synthase CPT3-like isoform X2 [Phragmites australis]|uniref:dehydrodolichyl diphosphate synthase CPT3-like isoform X2 n=1 Tax=Phragmites australis TaxID=29695 RepID=UPI002D7A113B|nr:dehydrodolichyl diphosphate synthase CPT3-like isoform X2 [Phragmites australis]